MAHRHRILLTAFQPFGSWAQNASQLCLDQLLPLLADKYDVTTRVYPVQFEMARPLIESDLAGSHDLVLHLGQAQSTARIRLEAVGLNIGMRPGDSESDAFSLDLNGPAAYQSRMPLAAWAESLRAAGYPAYVSHHAGTYLCNATLYWSTHCVTQQSLATEVLFVHVPLDLSQVVGLPGDFLSLPAQLTARGLLELVNCWAAEKSPEV